MSYINGANEGEEMNDPFFFKWQKRIINWRLFKYAIIFLFIGLFIGVGLGQWWRIAQVEPEHHAKIEKMENIINYYRKNWTPIREKVEVKSKQELGPKRGK